MKLGNTRRKQEDTSMDNIQLSIIIPHYNTPDSLIQLVQTIPVRRDIQILIVDDNSTVDMAPIDRKSVV